MGRMRHGTARSSAPTVAMRRGTMALVCCCLVAVSVCLGAAAALFVTKGRYKALDLAVGAPDRPLVTVPAQLAGVIDDRARFRQIFCALDADHGARFSTRRTCADSLHRLAGEDAPPSRPVSLGRAGGTPLLHIVLIPGMFGQCVKNWARPLEDAAAYLRSQGYRVDTIDVGGRSSSEENADTIARALPQLLKPGEHLLIIGYSKGLSDILETLAVHPQAIPPGSTIVSLAGIVSGTPIADHTPALERLVSDVPLPSCGSGDRGAVASVSRRYRVAWLADHPLPTDRSYFSIAAFTDNAHVSRPLEESYRELSAIDPRNDGQVIATDAIIPGSHLLGYLNADHWAVALPLANNVPKLRRVLAGRNDYPREILLEAIVRSVEESKEPLLPKEARSRSSERKPLQRPRS